MCEGASEISGRLHGLAGELSLTVYWGLCEPLHSPR